MVTNFNSDSKLNSNIIGSYLAGIIEGDGSIIVSNKTKLIRICFNKKDQPLAEYLIKLLNIGKLVTPKKGNYVLWEITKYEDQIKIINLINSYFRTPKLEAQHRLIDKINENKNLNIIKYKLDFSPINKNNWLSGFIDADGNFNTIIAPRKNKNLIRIQTQFRLELKQSYHRINLINSYGITYWDIISIIANYLGVNVYNRSRFLEKSITYQYYIVSSSNKSKNLLINYQDTYPLYSSKYLDYLDWCKIIKLSNNKELKKDFILSECNKLKSQMNNNRKIFNWDHLNNIQI